MVNKTHLSFHCHLHHTWRIQNDPEWSRKPSLRGQEDVVIKSLVETWPTATKRLPLQKITPLSLCGAPKKLHLWPQGTWTRDATVNHFISTLYMSRNRKKSIIKYPFCIVIYGVRRSHFEIFWKCICSFTARCLFTRNSRKYTPGRIANKKGAGGDTRGGGGDSLWIINQSPHNVTLDTFRMRFCHHKITVIPKPIR